MEKFKKHPTNVLKSRGKITRVHVLEIARRAMEKGGEGDMMPLTSAEMPNPLQARMVPQDPSAQWAGLMSAPPGGALPPTNPMAGMMGGGNVAPE